MDETIDKRSYITDVYSINMKYSLGKCLLTYSKIYNRDQAQGYDSRYDGHSKWEKNVEGNFYRCQELFRKYNKKMTDVDLRENNFFIKEMGREFREYTHIYKP